MRAALPPVLAGSGVGEARGAWGQASTPETVRHHLQREEAGKAARAAARRREPATTGLRLYVPGP